MLGPLLGSVLSAGTSLLGGYLGRESQEDQRAKNEALQREFAQNSVQWRVADAKKAGIHPLYAMGAPTMSPSVGVQNDPLASAIGGMGGDITRAATAMSSPVEKMNVTQTALEDMQLTNMALRNDLLASQIRKLNQPGNPPGVNPPIGDAGTVPVDPKIEQNPRMIMDGEETRGDPEWSPTKVLSDSYGDENPVVQYIYGPLKMWKDYTYNNLVRDRMIPRGYDNQSGRRHGGGGW